MREYLGNFPSTNFSICATVILIFTYNVLLERDMECTCEKQTLDCGLYMGLPCFIILVLILWMDKTFQRTCRYSCTSQSQNQDWRQCCKGCCSCTFCCVIVHHIIKAVFVGALWVVFVFLDGDWFVCCGNYGSDQQLACKDKKNLTAEERVIIAELKNSSKVIGSTLLVVIIILAAIIPLLKWKKCCEKISTHCDRRTLYNKLILEEEENEMTEILRRSAKKQLTEGIENQLKGEQWEECFNVAATLIKDSTKPEYCGEQQQPTGPQGEQQQHEPTAGPSGVQEGAEGVGGSSSEEQSLLRNKQRLRNDDSNV
ncbi:uncharacterized protein LOC108879745 [Lates calcarifer]|uniref:Uncharacterized protein LOC108879745 n=1 Tax=Lates calcarifer TaxID=8187 RepID=A0AAJ7PII2_LATCA|nr:uncharacterized protein LOC108879745 [Lates calcarifer]